MSCLRQGLAKDWDHCKGLGKVRNLSRSPTLPEHMYVYIHVCDYIYMHTCMYGKGLGIILNVNPSSHPCPSLTPYSIPKPHPHTTPILTPYFHCPFLSLFLFLLSTQTPTQNYTTPPICSPPALHTLAFTFPYY